MLGISGNRIERNNRQCNNVTKIQIRNNRLMSFLTSPLPHRYNQVVFARCPGVPLSRTPDSFPYSHK